MWDLYLSRGVSTTPTTPLLSKMYVKLKLPFNIQARESTAEAEAMKGQEGGNTTSDIITGATGRGVEKTPMSR